MAKITLLFLTVVLIYFILTLLSTESAPEDALVSQIPGFTDNFPSKHFSGYVTIDENHGKKLYYYFVLSEGNPTKDPVVLWLNGGPGCSSFDGFVYEHGPFNFETGETKGSLPKLHLNPYSWSKVSNIIYLDSPAGVGFSYSGNKSDYITGDLKTASDSHTFLLKWFELYPEFLSNPFFISGESYAGVYVPTLAYEVMKGIDAGEKPVLNFKGYIVGNGVTDEEFDGNAFVPFAYGMGLISQDLFEEVTAECQANYYNPATENCENKLAKVDKTVEGLNMTLLSVSLVKAEDAYRYFTWTVTYGTASPMVVPQQVILINGQFPGPRLDVVTNDNLIINVINKLDAPFLLTWNGIKQRKNSWQDGVLGTNCPIPPNSNFTYKFQTKDQIGTYTYFPSTFMHKAAGGFGGLNVYARSVIPVPYPTPAADFTLLIGDWYKTSHKALQQFLDSGKSLPFPDGILINGKTQSTFSGDQGKTYMFRISNVGLSTSINFRIQGHTMKLVEVEGSHVVQNTYDSLDVHVGQSLSVLVTLNQSPKDYYIVASTRFAKQVLTAASVLHYTNSQTPVSGPVPASPADQIQWSMNQARSLRWNLTANAARPNPQGSYHYGKITTTKTFVFANSAPLINGKQRYAVNRVSYINPDTPLKLADYFNIPGVFSMDSIQSVPSDGHAFLATSVVPVSLHDFIEVVFQNNENAMQSWHLDGYDFWVVGYGSGQWSSASRTAYNLDDALTRHTAQVYPNSWTAILVSLDNQGMWNMRSAIWERQYVGQQFYLRVFNPNHSLANEYDIPPNALLCGKAVGRHS